MRSLALALALLTSTTALAVPMQLNHQGVLYDSVGAPLEGAHSLAIAIYAEQAGGSPLWTDTLDIQADAGAYSVVLGANTPLEASIFDGTVRYVELAVDGSPALPQRLPITSVPYAMRAGEAEIAQGLAAPLDWSSIANAPEDQDSLADLACDAGQTAVFDGIAWGCGDATPATVDVSTLNGTIAITNLPVGGGADQVAAGDHTHGFGELTGVAAYSQLPVGTTSNTVAAGDHSHNLVDLGGDLPMSRVTGDLPMSRVTGDLPMSRVTGDLPMSRVTGDLAASRISGILGIGQIPTGTTGTTVALGNHTHTAASIGALPASGGSLTGSLQVGSSGATCNSAAAGTIRWDGTNFLGCNGTEWLALGAGGGLGGSNANPGSSCAAILAARPTSTSGAYWIDTDGGGSQPPIEVFCDMTTEGGGWLDLVRTFHISSNDPATLMNRFFVTNGVGGTKIRPGVANDLGTGEVGFYLDNYDYYAANHTQGFHFRPQGMSYTRVRLSYRMQGTQQTHNRCANGNWVPLNGPGYNGGYSGYLSPCLSGFTCIQGTPTDGRDAPIAATYSNDSINSSNTLLTWSGSTDEPLSNGCSRDANIPTSHPTTWFTRFLVR
jgi:hypothetical protein